MKKFLVFLIGFVFLGLIVLAQTPEENFQKAGQSELAKREAVLLQQKAEIEKFFNEMADDAVIFGQEMENLKQVVNEFDKRQEQYNKELEFYNLKTVTEIPDVIRKHLEIYFDEQETSPYYRDNSNQEIRRYFTEQTGRGIKVEKGDNLGIQFGIAFLMALLVGFVVFAIFALISNGPLETCFAVASIAFLFALCIVFLAL